MLAVGIFLFVLFIPVAAVLILVWAVWAVFSFVRWIVSRILLGKPWPQTEQIPVARRCARSRCHADNPSHARFCRRCGQPVVQQFVLRAA